MYADFSIFVVKDVLRCRADSTWTILLSLLALYKSIYICMTLIMYRCGEKPFHTLPSHPTDLG